MRHENLVEKKGRRSFYCRSFQKAVSVLLGSVVLNLVLSAAIHSRLVKVQEPDFYATNGVSFPILLAPLDAPNLSSTPLLQDSPPEEMVVRDLPENV